MDNEEYTAAIIKLANEFVPTLNSHGADNLRGEVYLHAWIQQKTDSPNEYKFEQVCDAIVKWFDTYGKLNYYLASA